MSTKKKTTTTVTPENPTWVTSGVQDQMGRINDLAGQDPSSFIADPSQLTQQQFGLAGQLGEAGAGAIGSAMGIAGGLGGYSPQQVTAGTINGMDLSGYMNPEVQGVVDTSMADLERQRQIQQQYVGDQALQAKAFGGSREAVARSLTDDNFTRAAATTAANLRQDAYYNAQQQAQTDLNRQMQASLANQGAGLAAAGIQGDAARTLSGLGALGLGSLTDAAGVQQSIDQAQAAAPLTVGQATTGMTSSLPLNLFNGQTQTQTTKSGGLGSVVGTALQLAPFALAPFTGGASLGLGGLAAGAGAAANAGYMASAASRFLNR